MRHAFSPGRIGRMDLNNRIVMLPMGTHYADDDGFVTERLLDFYEERAKGGVGLVIVEVSCVDSPVGKLLGHMMVIDDDKYLPGLTRLARVIRKHGARAAIQLGHAGNATRSKITGMQPVAPSPVKRWGLYEVPREMTTEDIRAAVHRFADAAERARRAGFDAVEIHAAHSYLVSQFLSSAWNQRQDQYGGSLANRTRFLLEIIAAIRERVGDDFPVWCRINGEEEGIEGGTTIEEAQAIARLVQGSVDAISVSATASGAAGFLKGSPETPGALLPLARRIKEAVDIPVIGAGRLTFEVGNAALKEQSIDFLGIGRALLCDPSLPSKWAAGQVDDVRPCIACLGCLSEADPLACAVNPLVGHERKSDVPAAREAQKVVVVGGGPAGMEAARVAASMGHRVTLFEKADELGGQLILASIPPEKREKIEPFTNYMVSQVRKSRIEVRLGVEADQALIEGEEPDVVILATGILPFLPEIRGIERRSVVQALDILSGAKEAGARVVVMGGELVGCETADFLAQRGRTVVITRRGPRFAAGMPLGTRRGLIDRLRANGVEMLANIRYEEITDEGLVISDASGSRLIEADTVVIAAGGRPNEKLYSALRQKHGGAKVFSTGDCFEPGGIKEALEQVTRSMHAHFAPLACTSDGVLNARRPA